MTDDKLTPQGRSFIATADDLERAEDEREQAGGERVEHNRRVIEVMRHLGNMTATQRDELFAAIGIDVTDLAKAVQQLLAEHSTEQPERESGP